MEFADFKQKGTKELEELLETFRQERRSLRFQIAARQLKNVRAIRKVRRQIAQVLTILKKKSKE